MFARRAAYRGCNGQVVVLLCALIASLQAGRVAAETRYRCVSGSSMAVYFVPVAGSTSTFPDQHYADLTAIKMDGSAYDNENQWPVSLDPKQNVQASGVPGRLPPGPNGVVTIAPTTDRARAGQCRIRLSFRYDKLPGGTASTWVTINDWCIGRVDVATIDDHFAPSAESCEVKYSMVPSNFAAAYAKIEVFKNGDATNPIYRKTDIAKTGTDVLHEWDGKANLGADNGKYMGPKDSAYTAKIYVSDKTDFSDGNNDSKQTKVEVESITLTPAGAETVVKPNRTATEIDKNIEALVNVKKKDNTGVTTEIPLKVDWSFEDPDDTSASATIDPNGAAGDDNCPVGKGGKRHADSIMWKALPGYTTHVNKNIADSETLTTGADKGKTKIQFSASAIAGDNYILVTQVKDAASNVLKEKKSGTWSVRKTVTFPHVYNMNGGVDAGAVMADANINPAFSGDGYTDYSRGEVHSLAAGEQSPEYVVPLVAPTDAQKPTQQEIDDLSAMFPADVNVDPQGDFPGPGDTDYNGNAVFDGAPHPDLAKQNAAVAAINAKAQAWYQSNMDSKGGAMTAYQTLIGATSPSIVGARYYHPKLDGRGATGQTAHYPDDARIRINAGPVPASVDPDSGDWYEPQGAEHGGVVYIFLNSGDAARRQIVGRHEAGHASDHFSFGDGDHAAAGLMKYYGESNTFSDDSILRLRGWTSNP